MPSPANPCVVERLNHQEHRHSQYFGEFNTSLELLTKDKFWDEVNLFTRRDSQRMKDAEFISELFVIVVDGLRDGQKTLDKFYSDYDVVFPKQAKRSRGSSKSLQPCRASRD